MDKRVTLSEGDIAALAEAAHCAPDKQIMAALRPVVEDIIAAREADVLRRVAEKWDAQKEAGLMLDEPWSRGYWNGIQTAIDALRDEAVYIERTSRPTPEGDSR